MIRAVPVGSRAQWAQFHHISSMVYAGNPFARNTEADLVDLLARPRSVFFSHARVESFLLCDGPHVVGRFSLIADANMPDAVEVAFFEAIFGLSDVEACVRQTARASFPDATRLIVGLCGHLNYAAGFLASRFDEPPIFGLPYSPPYYLDYFAALKPRHMVSYRFHNESFYRLWRENRLKRRTTIRETSGITVRPMDRRHLRREIALYTELNNACFQEHPFWTDRRPEEDYELFHPFRFLLKEENLLFAEDGGRPVGFLLWYPDFNQLAVAGETFGPRHVLAYQAAHTVPRDHARTAAWMRPAQALAHRTLRRVAPIDTTRLTEIAVRESHRKAGVVEALIRAYTKIQYLRGFSWTEGGFIFEDNVASITMTRRLLETAFGQAPEPYRRFVVFEDQL
jgi:GNAT superfamily N-acetyltransferase